MPFIIENFGTYIAYDEWRNGKTFSEYHVKLTNLTTLDTEIIYFNPINITDTSRRLERHKLYEGIFSSITLKIDFVNRVGYGGDFIKFAYDDLGVKAQMNCDIYRKNSDTNDYDIYYAGKIDFSEKSYEFDINENIISVTLIEQGKVNKLLSRDELNVNLKGGKSIDGNTITPFSNETETFFFPTIDIPLVVEAEANFNVLGSGDSGDSVLNCYEIANSIPINQIDDRLILNLDTREQVIYENSSGQTRAVQLSIEGTSTIQIILTPTDVSNNATVEVIGRINRTSFTLEWINDSETRSSMTEPVTLNFSNSISESVELEVLDSGQIRNYMVINFIGDNFDWQVVSNNTVQQIDITEISPGANQSNCRAYFIHEALTRLDQILTDETDDDRLIYSEYFGREDSEIRSYDDNGEGSRDILVNGFQLRQKFNKSFVLNFADTFQSLKSTHGVGMGFDSANNRFYIEHLSEFYKSNLVLNLGLVDKIKVSPAPHPNKILGGYDNEGEYEDFGGAYEQNLKSEHSFSFETKNTVNLRSVIRADSIGIETLRRKYNYSFESEDNDDDPAVFMCRLNTPRTGVEVGSVYDAAGFPLAGQRYNFRLTPRENLLRLHRYLRGYTWKTGESLVFNNNTKDIDCSYISGNYFATVFEQSDIDFSVIDSNPYFLPELYNIETKITNEQLNTILSDVHGIFACEDKFGEIYYFYIDSLEMQNQEKEVKIIGKRAFYE